MIVRLVEEGPWSLPSAPDVLTPGVARVLGRIVQNLADGPRDEQVKASEQVPR